MSNINRTDINNSSLDKTDLIKKKDTPRLSGPDKQVSAPGDSIVLSGKAKTIDRLTTQVQQSRLEQLAEIKAALDSGKYSVSGADIARKMIESNWK